MAWSDDQKRAIETRDKDILVAAAAGSGKTAVLVQRIIDGILGGRYDVDRILVVTFTHAAAAEMKERIGNALQKQLKEAAEAKQPDNEQLEQLERQLLLLSNASVSTFHSFCQSVIHQHFAKIDIDPAFRLAGEEEIALLKQEVAEATLEAMYDAEDNEAFLDFADSYGSDMGDEAIYDLLIRVYDFIRSQPNPWQWLQQQAAKFHFEEDAEKRLESSKWLQIIREAISRRLQEAMELSKSLLVMVSPEPEQVILAEINDAVASGQSLAVAPPGEEHYFAEIIRQDLRQIIKINSLFTEADGDWETAMAALASFKALATNAKLGSHKKPKGKFGDLYPGASDLRDRVKAIMKDLADNYSAMTLVSMKDEVALCAKQMDMLTQLMLQFGETFAAAKREKAIADFNDLEHMALAILSQEDEKGDLRPSDVAEEYQKFFQEIMVDEYQDTNGVQETIIRMIADPGKPITKVNEPTGSTAARAGEVTHGNEAKAVPSTGSTAARADEPAVKNDEALVKSANGPTRPNLFQVGDVKQSIYRFRLADPTLFMEKYDEYPQQDDACLIPLSKNFRSRAKVLAGVNYIFAQTMTEGVTGLKYDAKAALYPGLDYPEQENSLDGPVEIDLIPKDLATGGGELAEQSEGDSADATNSVSNADQGTVAAKDATKAARTTPQAASSPEGAVSEMEDLTGFSLEARFIAHRLQQLMAEDRQVFDPHINGYRQLQWRDIVVLLRSVQGKADVLLEELRNNNIPAYADVNGGYFEAPEISLMLALLSIIDNSRRDIELASVLVSPIVGLSMEELAQLRLLDPKADLLDTLLLGQIQDADANSVRDNGTNDDQGDGTNDDQSDGTNDDRNTSDDSRTASYDSTATTSANAVSANDDDAAALKLKKRIEAFHKELPELTVKISSFIRSLKRWRDLARECSVSQLLWRLYDDTGYYAYVGGLRGGLLRQANLRMLIDRADEFEQTSYRGLFRFLHFINRLRNKQTDLPAARTLSANENVVRIMTIHKSKGLEFPVVILADVAKGFNMKDLQSNVLLHKELGLGPLCIDNEGHQAYDSLPLKALKLQLEQENKAEELRVLYVALTRAREKLIIVGRCNEQDKLEKQWQGWNAYAEDASLTLPDYAIMGAKSYLDWIMLALSRYRRNPAEAYPEFAGDTGAEAAPESATDADADSVHCSAVPHPINQLYPADFLVREATASDLGITKGVAEDDPVLAAVEAGQPLEGTAAAEDVARHLTWQYDYQGLQKIPAKLSVTEIKQRFHEMASLDEGEVQSVELEQLENKLNHKKREFNWPEPSFHRSEAKLSGTDYGTMMHSVMQHIDLAGDLSAEGIEAQLQRLADQQLLPAEQLPLINIRNVARFFQSEVGQRMLQATQVWRELPFSRQLPPQRFYSEVTAADAYIFTQGVVDAMFQEADGQLVILDYKTDSVTNPDIVRERYQIQLDMYKEAMEGITGLTVKERYLYMLHDGTIVKL